MCRCSLRSRVKLGSHLESKLAGYTVREGWGHSQNRFGELVNAEKSWNAATAVPKISEGYSIDVKLIFQV